MANPFLKMEYGTAKAVLTRFEEKLTPEIVAEILKDPTLVEVGVESIAGRIKKFRIYTARFAEVVRACACDFVSSDLTVRVFGEDVFGTLGEGYVLAQPPRTEAAKKRGGWNEAEIDAWHASVAVAGEGLEASYLVDLAKYGEEHPDEQLTKVVVCWRAGKDGRVAFLLRFDGERRFDVDRRGDGCWYFRCWFLLRKVQKPSAL